MQLRDFVSHAEDTHGDQGNATFDAWCKKQVPRGVFLFIFSFVFNWPPIKIQNLAAFLMLML